MVLSPSGLRKKILENDKELMVRRPKMKQIRQLKGKIYFISTACMSVWADALSWANAHTDKVVKDPNLADHIVILSCQVTDLAILNDFRVTEDLMKKYPKKKYYISGCLAKRKDITLPQGVEPLDLPREPYQMLHDRSLVDYKKPFWVSDFSEEDGVYEDGHLFRNMYPLRIGKGCIYNCTYCTIRITRGAFAQYDMFEHLEKEFLSFDDVLLIADSPTVKQIKDWCNLAQKHNKKISIRNLEPSVAIRCKEDLLSLSRRGLLKIFHCPVQSSDEKVLKNMHRNVRDTLAIMDVAREMKKLGVFIATNIIIDYKAFNQDFSKVYELYDYVTWNPLWDGIWNRTKAEERWHKYFESGYVSLDIKNFVHQNS